MDIYSFLKEVPKVDLHVHLEGSVSFATYVELSQKHGVKLPTYKQPEDLFDDMDAYKFLQLYNAVADIVRDRDDFHRITYETLQEAAEHNVRYREMFWSPMQHLDAGISYKTALDGIIAGIHDAKKDFGIECKMIAAINRMESPEKGYAMVEEVLAYRRDELIGIGLDYVEANNPPEKFWKAYKLARDNGLHRTAHACEDAPPRNVETCLDLLGCERIDHGYHVLENNKITKRCVEEGVVFTTCPTGSAWGYFNNDFANHPIKEMAKRGLKIMVNCDDPSLLKTNPTKEYIVMADHMGFKPVDFKKFILNGIDGSWLDETTKRQWRNEWAYEIDNLISRLAQ